MGLLGYWHNVLRTRPRKTSPRRLHARTSHTRCGARRPTLLPGELGGGCLPSSPPVCRGFLIPLSLPRRCLPRGNRLLLLGGARRRSSLLLLHPPPGRSNQILCRRNPFQQRPHVRITFVARFSRCGVQLRSSIQINAFPKLLVFFDLLLEVLKILLLTLLVPSTSSLRKPAQSPAPLLFLRLLFHLLPDQNHLEARLFKRLVISTCQIDTSQVVAQHIIPGVQHPS
mmetsp:Transcript_5969/g.14211  ORF Transcript_5969/g.14211 Transcript_5969/m.14211 type:complete len:227 (-) Transcript_5969:1137-1817(-)